MVPIFIGRGAPFFYHSRTKLGNKAYTVSERWAWVNI
jgi:hypothetical protein